MERQDKRDAEWRSLVAESEVVEPLLDLATSDNGAVKCVLPNLVQILERDPAFAGRLSYCTFSDVLLVDGERMERQDIGEIAVSLDRYAIYPSETLLEWAVSTAARKNPQDPLADYVAQLEWDGVPRVDTWLRDYLGAKDEPLLRVIGRKWLISAMARATRPGCQVDTVLVMHGPQGNGKSSAIRALGDPWYMSSSIDVRSKDARVAIQGKWLIEWAELDALKRADANAAKAFITEREDDYRPPYGRSNVQRKRRCVFIGTTNDPTFLADSTGDRRFWVVSCGAIDLEGIEGVRHQLWAEALHLLEQGETWWLTQEEERGREELVEEFQMADPWEDVADRWIRAKYPNGGFAGEDLLTDQGELDRNGSWASIPGIALPTGQANPSNLGRLAKVLVKLGFVKKRVTQKGRKRRLWFKGEPDRPSPSSPPPPSGSPEQQGTEGPGEDQGPPVHDEGVPF